MFLRVESVLRLSQSMARLRATADANIRQKRLAEAEADLRRILRLPVPKDTPLASQLLQDTDFALATLLLAAGRPEHALAAAKRGLSRSQEPTVFRANLHAIRAMTLEAMNRPSDALTDYEHAVAIHKQLFDKALAEHKGSDS